MIGYRDFSPQESPGGFFKTAQSESFERVVEAANRWIRESGVNMINVETLLVPEPLAGELSTSSGELTSFEAAGFSSFRQVLRIWYTQ